MMSAPSRSGPTIVEPQNLDKPLEIGHGDCQCRMGAGGSRLT
jgi:hypothetical protein